MSAVSVNLSFHLDYATKPLAIDVYECNDVHALRYSVDGAESFTLIAGLDDLWLHTATALDLIEDLMRTVAGAIPAPAVPVAEVSP